VRPFHGSPSEGGSEILGRTPPELAVVTHGRLQRAVPKQISPATSSLWGQVRENLRSTLIILALAIAVRVAFMHLTGWDKGPLYFAEVERVARSLLTQNVFGNPYALPTGPTAHLAPVYPWLVSLLFRLFGTGGLGTLSVHLFNAVCASVQYALLVVLALACGLSPRVGILAGAVGALVPLHPLVEVHGWEASFVGMCWIAVLVFTIDWWRRCPASRLRAAFIGFCWGLLMLAAPSMLLVFLAVMTLYFLVVPHGTLGRAAIAVAAAGLVLLPWTIRNEKTFHHLFFIRSNFGLELSLSNHDGANPLFVLETRAPRDDNFFLRRHPAANPFEAQLIQQMGEANYHHERLKEAIQWIKTHPRAFLELTARRAGYFWFSTPWYRSLIQLPLVAAALVGLMRLFRVAPLAAWLFASCWLMFPLVYYFIFFDTRYAYPLNQSLLFLASFAFLDALKLVRRVVPGERERVPRTVLNIAAMCRARLLRLNPPGCLPFGRLSGRRL